MGDLDHDTLANDVSLKYTGSPLSVVHSSPAPLSSGPTFTLNIP